MYLLTEQQANAAGFELLDLKASGGTSVVYKARHKATDSTVALKLLSLAGNSQRLQGEASVVSSLHHPDIATFVDSGEIAGKTYLATRWIEGSSLHKLLDVNLHSEQQSLDIHLAMSLTRSIASALAYAHARGIVHGDINPNNILITPDHDARIIDFGIGRAIDDQSVTVTSELAGTPRYLAPEIIAGEPPSASSDQYALALVTYEMLTGQWPYSEQPSNTAAVLHHQLFTQATPICEVRPDLSESMNHVFGKALQKSPDQRYDNIQDFSDALLQAVSSAKKVGANHPSARLAFRIATLALVCTSLVVTSVWWKKEDKALPVLASVFTEDDRHRNSDFQTANTNLPDDSLCNLYKNIEFDEELEDNFYRDAQSPDLAIRVNHPDARSSPVLQLGSEDQYGLYGIIVDISGGQQYTFSADLMFKGYVHKAELTILWLDESWQTIEGMEENLNIERLFDGTFHLANVIAPDNAHYAVPTLYKDASAGVVYADNVRFSALDEPC